jgi:hypothetical protein
MIHEHAHNGVRVMVFNATFKNKYFSNYCGCQFYWMEGGRDLMVVWFTPTYAISAYHNYSLQHYVIKFVRDIQQVGNFLLDSELTSLCSYCLHVKMCVEMKFDPSGLETTIYRTRCEHANLYNTDATNIVSWESKIILKYFIVFESYKLQVCLSFLIDIKPVHGRGFCTTCGFPSGYVFRCLVEISSILVTSRYPGFLTNNTGHKFATTNFQNW